MLWKNKEKKQFEEQLEKVKKEYDGILLSLRSQNAELKLANAELEKKTKSFYEDENKTKEALVVAVDNVKAIEDERRKQFEFELEKLKKLNQKWISSICDVQEKYGLISEEELNSKAFADDIEDFLNNTICQEIKRESENVLKDQNMQNAADGKFYHKQLLNKMSGLMSSLNNAREPVHIVPEIIVPLPKIVEKKESEKTEIFAKKHRDEVQVQFESETQRLIKPLFENRNLKNAVAKGGYSSILEKYLGVKDDDVLSVDYSKKIVSAHENSVVASFAPNESGFDLREAVNPTESLEDILKELDF